MSDQTTSEPFDARVLAVTIANSEHDVESIAYCRLEKRIADALRDAYDAGQQKGRREGLREAAAFVTGKAAEANLKGAHIAYDTARYLADELDALASQEPDKVLDRLKAGE